MQSRLFSPRLFELEHSEEHVPQLAPQEVASSGRRGPGALQHSLMQQTQAVNNMVLLWTEPFTSQSPEEIVHPQLKFHPFSAYYYC